MADPLNVSPGFSPDRLRSIQGTPRVTTTNVRSTVVSNYGRSSFTRTKSVISCVSVGLVNRSAPRGARMMHSLILACFPLHPQVVPLKVELGINILSIYYQRPRQSFVESLYVGVRVCAMYLISEWLWSDSRYLAWRVSSGFRVAVLKCNFRNGPMPSTFAYDVPPPTPPVVRANLETAFYSIFALLIYDHLLTLSEEVCTFV